MQYKPSEKLAPAYPKESLEHPVATDFDGPIVLGSEWMVCRICVPGEADS